MKGTKRYLCSILAIGLLAGCANTATVKMPAEYVQPNKKIEVVIVEPPYPAEMGFREGSMFFGVLGVLADGASGEAQRDRFAKKIAAALGSWKSEDVLREKFEQQLAAKHYRIVGAGEIQSLPAQYAFDPKKGMGDIDAMSRAVTFWHDPEKTVFDHSRRISQYRPDAIIEAGYEGYRIEQRYGQRSITITLRTKIIKPSTGEVIARNRSYVVGGLSGGTPNHAKLIKYDLNNEAELRPFAANYKAVFEQEVAELVKESIASMGL